MTRRRIAITGFMCSGKTTVARALAQLLDCEAVDLDELITRNEKRSPGEIIDREGEEAFREIETRVLESVLSENDVQIVALGGGSWTNARNRSLLSQNAFQTLWLDVPFEVCWERIQNSQEPRPLASTLESAKRRYDERLMIYETADLKLRVDENEGADQIAARIAALVLRNEANT